MTDHKKVSVIRKISRTTGKERTEEMVYKLRNAHSVMNYSLIYLGPQNGIKVFLEVEIALTGCSKPSNRQHFPSS